ncbi:type II secretion system protein N [Brevundimonas sp.]|uniref:type II secretion system protein N n=1 Tax=Brevundimonas sp. TaxID=1871086 RepID=UPI0025F1C875|nr:type II secretion system protein N [Brevundimonas sp.]
MRIVGLTLTFAVVLLVTMIAGWPMRAALGAAGVDRLGLSAREVTGTLWSGRLSDARLGDISLGDVEARLAFWPMLAGETRLSLEASDGPFAVELVRAQDRAGVRGLDIQVPLATFGLPGQAGGTATLTQSDILFVDGRCAQASGRVRIDGLAGPGWTAPALDGALACHDGLLLARMNGADERFALAADLRVRSSGAWTLTLLAQPRDPLLAPLMEAQGFAPGPEGLTYEARGSLNR